MYKFTPIALPIAYILALIVIHGSEEVINKKVLSSIVSVVVAILTVLSFIYYLR